MLMALPAIPAHARPHHGEAWARDRFAAAERMREALNGRPPADRTRRDYQRVINAYRNIYYGAPTSTKADPSVVAVAETLVEMGRRFDDDRVLHEAISQYKFLRREYPGSKYRCDALFTIGEIYSEDLNDPEQARATFQDFLHRYPRNRLVEDARQAIVELDRQTAEKKSEVAQGRKAENDSPAKSDGSSDTAANFPADESNRDEVARGGGLAPQESVANFGRLPRVTGIRHWSTPDYTRVAIDLESGVTFTSQRIANPDRIYFDLRDTKLASTLVGKSFDVDDGFLKKIRVAQFQPGRTRVVLEVDDLSDYDAFLLPDPYRLIIDIHGQNTQAENSPAKGLNDAGESARETRVSASAEKSKPQGSAETATEIDDSSSEIAESKTVEPSKAESKLEVLRTEAGKAPVTRQDVGDDARIVAKTDANASTAGERRSPAVAKRERSAVTKVVVGPDDDDDSTPVEAAKLDVPDQPSFSEGSGKHASNADSETKSDTAKSATRGRSASRNHHQAPSRAKRDESASTDIEVREASPTSNGDRSLIRALGLKIGKIVIDPGHGGHDTGTIGPNGLEEKDLVLDVGRRLGKLLETRFGAEVVYTRKDDFHSSRNANCDCKSGARRSVYFDSR
jgi:N-acetylmuramoyl-L-alanine amidase